MERILIEMLQSESIVAVILSLLLFYIVWSESSRKKREQSLIEERHKEKLAEVEYRNEVKTMLRELNFRAETENGHITHLSNDLVAFKADFKQIKDWVHDMKNYEQKERGYKDLFEKRIEFNSRKLDEQSDVINWHSHRLVHLENCTLDESQHNKIPEFKGKSH